MDVDIGLLHQGWKSRLRGFVNRFLRKIFRSNRGKAARGRRNVSDWKARQIYSDVRIKEDDIGGAHGSRGGENKFVQEVGAKAWSKEALGKPGRGWKDRINPLAPDFFFILAHPVYKMWITQEPNTLALWNKLHFEEKITESIEHV